MAKQKQKREEPLPKKKLKTKKTPSDDEKDDDVEEAKVFENLKTFPGEGGKRYVSFGLLYYASWV